MPKTTHPKRNKQSIEAHFAIAERALRGIDKSVDEQLERRGDLEVAHAIALHKSGKADVIDGDTMIQEARKRIG